MRAGLRVGSRDSFQSRKTSDKTEVLREHGISHASMSFGDKHGDSVAKSLSIKSNGVQAVPSHFRLRSFLLSVALCRRQ